MVLSLMFLSLPIPIPFDWQLPEVKKLNFVDQYFSPYVLPRLGVLWSLRQKPLGESRRGRRGSQEAEGGKQACLCGLTVASTTGLDFSQVCFFLLLHDILWMKSPKGKRRL